MLQSDATYENLQYMFLWRTKKKQQQQKKNSIFLV